MTDPTPRDEDRGALDLDRLDALAAAATPGWWFRRNEDVLVAAEDPEGEPYEIHVATAFTFDDAQLMAEFRTAVPDLVAELRQARAALEAVKGLADETRTGVPGDLFVSIAEVRAALAARTEGSDRG